MQSQGGALMIDGGTEVTKFQSPWETRDLWLPKSAILYFLLPWIVCTLG